MGAILRPLRDGSSRHLVGSGLCICRSLGRFQARRQKAVGYWRGASTPLRPPLGSISWMHFFDWQIGSAAFCVKNWQLRLCNVLFQWPRHWGYCNLACLRNPTWPTHLPTWSDMVIWVWWRSWTKQATLRQINVLSFQVLGIFVIFHNFHCAPWCWPSDGDLKQADLECGTKKRPWNSYQQKDLPWFFNIFHLLVHWFSTDVLNSSLQFIKRFNVTCKIL